MKKALLTIIFLLLYFVTPICLKAQYSITLGIAQPPELSVSELSNLTYIGDAIQLGSADMVTGGSGKYFYHWDPESGLDDPNIAQPMASPEEDITYTLTVSDANGCSALTTQAVLVDLTSISVDFYRTSLNIYPNPNSGRFKLEIHGHFSNQSKLWITNILGELVHEIDEIPLGDVILIDFSLEYPTGIYLLFLLTEESSFNTPLIIQ